MALIADSTTTLETTHPLSQGNASAIQELGVEDKRVMDFAMGARTNLNETIPLHEQPAWAGLFGKVKAVFESLNIIKPPEANDPMEALKKSPFAEAILVSDELIMKHPELADWTQQANDKIIQMLSEYHLAKTKKA